MHTFTVSLFIIAACCFTGYQCQIFTEENIKMVYDCFKEQGVTEMELEELKNDEMKMDEVKDNVKCAAQCIMVKGELMDGDGNFFADKFEAAFENTPVADAVKKTIPKCKDIKGANPCDTAFQILGCFKEIKSLM